MRTNVFSGEVLTKVTAATDAIMKRFGARSDVAARVMGVVFWKANIFPAVARMKKVHGDNAESYIKEMLVFEGFDEDTATIMLPDLMRF